MIRNCEPLWQNVSRNDCTVWTVFMGYTNCCAMYCLVFSVGGLAQWYNGICVGNGFICPAQALFLAISPLIKLLAKS